MAEVVMDDMALGNPAYPEAQRMALVSLFPGIPIAQVPLPSNWKLWLNFPDAAQHDVTLPKAFGSLGEDAGTIAGPARRNPEVVCRNFRGPQMQLAAP